MTQDAGAAWMRGGLVWKQAEPAEGTFDYGYTDTILNGMTDAGFSPIIFIYQNPGWIANTPCGPIDTKDSAKLAAFSTFMYNMASRYPKVKVWSLYNEPDNSTYAATSYSSGGCFGNDTTNDINGNGVNDRAEYASMLAAAWKAVHTANPNAQLAIGAVAYDAFDAVSAPTWYGTKNGWFNYNFLPELFAYMQSHPLSNGEKYADLLMFNYYDGYSLQWQKVSSKVGIMSKADWLQRQMQLYGLNLPMFVGESGSNSAVVGDNQQAACLNMTMIRGYVFGLRGVIWWTFGDTPTSNLYYGVVDQNLVAKPAYYAYKTLTRELNGYVYSRTLTNNPNFPGVEAYKFTNGNLAKTVLWSSGIITPYAHDPCATTRKVTHATFGAGANRLRVTGVTGQTAIITDNSTGDSDSRIGYIAIAATGSPVFVQVNP